MCHLDRIFYYLSNDVLHTILFAVEGKNLGGGNNVVKSAGYSQG